MNTFINNLSQLIVDLFSIWEYPSFSLLIVVVCCYLAVLLVKSLVNH